MRTVTTLAGSLKERLAQIEAVGRRPQADIPDYREAGGITAEYAIAILTAAGFAGLLLAILQSDAVRGWLLDIVQRALN
ncbi:MAG: DUF4244 domain-containing protein [Bifidobacteriaceae bacterium]|jgi:hypothetical protein|nr:DUF4244 domain-containing protein [Bifidobacteriaceae bacterium]